MKGSKKRIPMKKLYQGKYCCKMMFEQSSVSCPHHRNDTCPDQTVFYKTSATASGREIKSGILIHDGGSSFIEINFCPWCGLDLKSLSDYRIGDST